MKKYLIILSVVVLLAFAHRAEALIVDLPDDGGVGFFKDLSTGYTWMDIDNFFGQSYTQINNSLISSVFHIASLAEIEQLKLSAPADPDLFALHASIMGSSTTRNLIWGYYDEDGNPVDGGGWNFKWGPNPFGEPIDQWFTPLGSGTNEVFSDLGGWVVHVPVQPPVIPEPATLTLISTGLLAQLIRRRKNSP